MAHHLAAAPLLRALLPFVALLGLANAACQNAGFVEYPAPGAAGSRCYQLFMNATNNQLVARSRCSALGADLASVHSDAQFYFFIGMLSSAVPGTTSNTAVWLGMQFVRNAGGNITCVYNNDQSPPDYANPTSPGFASQFPWNDHTRDGGGTPEPNNNFAPELCTAMQKNAAQPGFMADYPCSGSQSAMSGYFCVEVPA